MNFFSSLEFPADLSDVSRSLCSEAIALRKWLTEKHDDQLVMLAPAIHEAGHVFAARAYGFEVAWVSLDSEFIKTNSLAIENGCASGLPVAMVIASPRVEPIFRRGVVISRKEWNTVKGYVMQCMAGPIAEASFNKHFQVDVAARDKLQANTLLWAVTRPSRFKFRSGVKKLLKSAHNFVELNREAIFYLAVMVHNCRTILNQDIDTAIAIARQLAAGKSFDHSWNRFFGVDQEPEHEGHTGQALRISKVDQAA